MEIRDHLLLEARQCPSPNCDLRSPDASLDLIVIHCISLPPGCFGAGDIDALFTNTLRADADTPHFEDYRELCELRVSSHLLIDRSGRCVQYVPFDCRAWHAGVSAWCGREGCNDFSIGIELEGTDEAPYEPAQYRALTAVVRALWLAYPSLAPDAVVGHSDIAPGRKTDPGPAFDWARLWSALG